MSSYTPLPSGLATLEPPSRADAWQGDDSTHVTASVARRFAERFALITFGLYHLPLFLNNYMSFGGGGASDQGLAVTWGHVFTVPGIWVARHVFGITRPMPGANAGDNGDVAEEFARLLLGVVIGLVGAAWWTWADRKKPRALWTSEALRILLRYSIALGLMGYAIAKIYPMQFPPLDPRTLELRVGQLTPMSLLWTFMQASRPYALFGGVMECAVIALLCFRRTTTLGALLCIVVMSNVAMLNIAYDVQVKLYATMIVLSAAVLALYDAPRLIRVFVTDRPTSASEEPTRLRDRIPAWLRWTIKFTLVGSVLVSALVSTIPTVHAMRDDVARTGGTWIVTSFAAGTPGPAATPAPAWRRVLIGPGGLAVLTASDSLLGCARTAVAGGQTFNLSCRGGRQGQLRWDRAGDTLRLTGTFADAPLTVTAVRGDSLQRLTSHRIQIVR